MSLFPRNARAGQTHRKFGRKYVYSETTETWSPIVPLASAAEARRTAAVASSATTFYATAAELPLSNNTTGALAFVNETNRLYVWSGTGWYNIATISSAGSSITGAASTYTLATNGTPTVITLNQTGLTSPTWSYEVTSGSIGRTATVTQADNVFTFTPSTRARDINSFGITFKATDGSNTLVTTSQFSMSNTAPVISSGPSATYTLASDGTPTVITLAATDADGHDITWSYEVVSGSLGGTTVSINGSEFTITPSTNSADAGTFQLRFVASDGASFDAEISEFGLEFAPNWTGATLLHTLNNPNRLGSALNDNFGTKTVMDGNYVAIYAPDYEYGGSVYIFDAVTGTLLRSIGYNYAGASDYDEFGWGLSLSGNYLAIGARREDDGNSDTGIVYIYDVRATTGDPAKIIRHPTDTSNGVAHFGRSVAMTGNTLVVGTRLDYAYIYKTTDGSWTDASRVHTIFNPGTSNGALDEFAYSMSASGDYVIIGAFEEADPGAANSGRAYIYNVNTGALVHTINNPNAFGTAATDTFSWSVAMNGNYVVVGAYQEDDADGTDSGKVYVFKTTDGSWTDTILLHTLDNPNAYGTSGYDYFGESVAMNGECVIVGARSEDDASGTQSGKAYIFDLVTGALLKTLDNPNAYDNTGSDNFGYSVAISGRYATVGAQYEDQPNGNSAGKAYIFKAG